MKNMKLTAAVVALIAAAVFTPSAKAAVGDLVLGLYDGTSGGAPSSLEVDLGAYKTLTFGETFNLGTTVTSEFSSDSSADILFDIAASGNTAGPGGGGLSVKDVAFTAATLPNIGGTAAAGNIDGMYNLVSSTPALTTGTSSTGTSFKEVSILDATAGSFEKEVSANSGNFGYGGGIPSEILSSFPNAAADFYLVPAGTNTATEEGVFTFSTVGGNTILTYSQAPEPSTYALFLCGGLVSLWMFKRRNSVA